MQCIIASTASAQTEFDGNVPPFLGFYLKYDLRVGRPDISYLPLPLRFLDCPLLKMSDGPRSLAFNLILGLVFELMLYGGSLIDDAYKAYCDIVGGEDRIHPYLNINNGDQFIINNGNEYWETVSPSSPPSPSPPPISHRIL